MKKFDYFGKLKEEENNSPTQGGDASTSQSQEGEQTQATTGDQSNQNDQQKDEKDPYAELTRFIQAINKARPQFIKFLNEKTSVNKVGGENHAETIVNIPFSLMQVLVAISLDEGSEQEQKNREKIFKALDSFSNNLLSLLNPFMKTESSSKKNFLTKTITFVKKNKGFWAKLLSLFKKDKSKDGESANQNQASNTNTTQTNSSNPEQSNKTGATTSNPEQNIKS